MAQQLKEPETSTPLADYVYQKLGKGAPSRRSIIKYGLAGLLIGGGILSENIRHAYASHGSPTDILDDAISSESASLEQFVELENIGEASVIAPVAGRVKIFRSSADDLLKGKNPDDSIFNLEPSGSEAFLNVAQDWTAIQTFTLETNFEADIDMDGNNIFNVDQIRGQTTNRLKLQARREDDDIAFLLTTPNVTPTFTETTRLTITGRLATAVAIWTNIVHSGFVAGGDIDMVTNSLVSGANSIITFGATTMNFNSRAVSNLVLGNPMNANSQDIERVNLITFNSAQDVRLLSLATKRLDIQTHNAGITLTTRMTILGNASVVDIDIINADLDLNSNLLKSAILGTDLNGGGFDIIQFRDLYKQSGVAGNFQLLARDGKTLNIFTDNASDADTLRMTFFEGSDQGSAGVNMHEPMTMKNVTSTPPTPVDGSIVFAQDVSSSSELFGKDEAGNEVQLTSHNFTLFNPSLVLEYPWSFYAKNVFLGKEIGVDIGQAMLDLQGLTGKKYMHMKSFQPTLWSDHQLTVKTKFDQEKKDALVQKELEKEKEVQIGEAIELVNEEESIRSDEDESYYKIKEDGTIELSTRKKIVKLVIGVKYVIKKGYRFDEIEGRFYRFKNEAEAIEDTVVPDEDKYKIKDAPSWMKQRGVN